MILLDNYSKINTYIQIIGEEYSVIDKVNEEQSIDGEGGFSDEGELLGIFLEGDKLFFRYNNKSYETSPSDLVCTYEIMAGGICNFKVKIKKEIVCDITYEPYISPLAMAFEEDDDEFDYLLYLSRLIKDEESILQFISWINNIRE